MEELLMNNRAALYQYTDPYYVFHVLGLLSVLIMNLYRSKYYGFTKIQALILTMLVYPAAYGWMLILYWIANGFSGFGGQNIVRLYIWIPLVAYPFAKLLKMDWNKTCDYIAPDPMLSHGISHIGCIFPGCCHGYPCSWGIYSQEAEAICFPVQIFESVTALAILVYLLWYCKKNDYETKGKAYPIMLVLYGSTRFIWEFFRDNEKMIFGISDLGLHALLMTAIGLIWLFYIRKKEKVECAKVH